MTTSRKDSCLSILRKIGLKFDDSKMESQYMQFKNELQVTIAFTFNIIFIILGIYGMIFDFAIWPKSGHKKLQITLLFVASVISIILRLKSTSLHILLNMAIAILYQIKDGLNVAEDALDPKEAYAWGNLNGILLTITVLSLKRLEHRIALHAILTVSRILILGWLTPITDAIILLLIYVNDDYNDRKKFKEIHLQRNNIENFKEMLQNEFPIGVAIYKNQLQTPFFFNDNFQKEFLIKPGEELFNQIIISDNFIPSMNINASFSLLSDSRDKVTLQQYLESHKLDSFQDAKKLQGFLIDHSGDHGAHLQIMLKSISWNKQPALSLFMQDVTEKDMVIALKMADQQKDKVIATVSHELRTPINGIMGLLSMIKDAVKDEMKVLEYAQNCSSCSALLLYLVNSILDLSQIRNNKITIVKDNVDMKNVLTEIQSLYLFQTRQKKIDLFIDIDPKMPSFIYTDKYRMVQILVNLIGNAMKFTFRGSITVKVKPMPCRKRVRFEVIDTGIGIKEEDKDKLFKMFGKLDQQDKNINSQGVGLGLTISNSLVQLLNDSEDKEAFIHVESEYKTGSTFWFYIDAVEEDKYLEIGHAGKDPSTKLEIPIEETDVVFDTIANSPKLPYQLPRNRLSSTKTTTISQIPKVLIVDDNSFNLMVLQNILQKFPIDIKTAFHGQQALEILEQEQDFQLILMDIQMPILDGIETSNIIQQRVQRNQCKDIPIIALTAHIDSTNEAEMAKYQQAGLRDAISKPLNEEIVRDLLIKFNCI